MRQDDKVGGNRKGAHAQSDSPEQIWHTVCTVWLKCAEACSRIRSTRADGLKPRRNRYGGPRVGYAFDEESAPSQLEVEMITLSAQAAGRRGRQSALRPVVRGEPSPECAEGHRGPLREAAVC